MVGAASRPGRFAREHGRAHFMDVLHELFCVGDVCSPFVPGMADTLGYTDNDHVNEEGALYLAPFISCWFQAEGLLI